MELIWKRSEWRRLETWLTKTNPQKAIVHIKNIKNGMLNWLFFLAFLTGFACGLSTLFGACLLSGCCPAGILSGCLTAVPETYWLFWYVVCLLLWYCLPWLVTITFYLISKFLLMLLKNTQLCTFRTRINFHFLLAWQNWFSAYHFSQLFFTANANRKSRRAFTRILILSKGWFHDSVFQRMECNNT